MRVHLITLRYSPERAAFDDAPLRAALEGASILTLREYFFVTEDLPHLLWVVTCAARADRGAPACSQRALPPTAPSASGDRQDPTTPRPSPRDDLDAEGQAVYDRLRRCRAQTAKQEGVPPYVVLTNRQLSAIVQAKPESKAALGKVEGVGDKKVERYGEPLLGLLARAEAPSAPAPVPAEASA